MASYYSACLTSFNNILAHIVKYQKWNGFRLFMGTSKNTLSQWERARVRV
jgi:hypothetical protein